jgi:hypothetical protein
MLASLAILSLVATGKLLKPVYLRQFPQSIEGALAPLIGISIQEGAI